VLPGASPAFPNVELTQLDAQSPEYATRFVDRLLQAAVRARASDVHVHPTERGLEVRWRIDGVLQSLGVYSRGESADVITRLKVLAELLTYHTDVPQEGRLREPPCGVEMRVSTFPTLHGERAAIRIFASSVEYLYLSDLGLPEEIEQALANSLHQTAGALLVTGPAGSGKTTTVYACLRELVRESGSAKSIVTLEDPIESAIEHIAQSQVKPAAGFTLASGLRSLLRQDPEVILVGEIRDQDTAEAVFQASLTGHLVLSTFHAGSVAEAVGRLMEMGIEPYLLRSGLEGVLCQRLLRRLCTCKRAAASDEELLDLPVPKDSVRLPQGCPACLNTGYRGRVLIAELVSRAARTLSTQLLQRADTTQLEQAAANAGVVSLFQRASEVVAAGETSPGEVCRILGIRGGRRSISGPE
jgi:type II secretory ATPase GspE/PulE/Tfp pilus assembly ATPase PilB-like protein